jgi:DNA-binding transcriptional LysR family regulator
MGRGLLLTTAGTEFLGYAKRLLGLAEEARLSTNSNGRPAGRLTIAASESLLTHFLPQLLRTLQCERFGNGPKRRSRDYDR